MPAKNTREMLDRLAAAEPATLACMHGSAWRGDGANLLRALADELDRQPGCWPSVDQCSCNRARIKRLRRSDVKKRPKGKAETMSAYAQALETDRSLLWGLCLSNDRQRSGRGRPGTRNVRASNREASARTDESLRPWLVQVAINLSRDLLRRDDGEAMSVRGFPRQLLRTKRARRPLSRLPRAKTRR